jgi:hypothetical protein
VPKLRGAWGLIALGLLGCGDDPPIDLELMAAKQTQCLDEGGLDSNTEYFDEPISDDICACIVASDERAFAPSMDMSDASAPEPDPRVEDGEYAQWLLEARKTRCGCCHNARFEGPGTAYWDASFTPVWTDSATDRRLLIMAGLGDKDGQFLPLPDMEGFQAFVRAEIARRELAR